MALVAATVAATVASAMASLAELVASTVALVAAAVTSLAAAVTLVEATDFCHLRSLPALCHVQNRLVVLVTASASATSTIWAPASWSAIRQSSRPPANTWRLVASACPWLPCHC